MSEIRVDRLPEFLTTEMTCAQFPMGAMERCTSEVAIRIPGMDAIDCVLVDASRESYMSQERQLVRDRVDKGFRIAVESIPPGRSMSVTGFRRGDEEATVHIHVADSRTISCIMFHYTISRVKGDQRLREETEARSVYASGRPVVSGTYRFNPFRVSTGFVFRRKREQALRQVLRRGRGSGAVSN